MPPRKSSSSDAKQCDKRDIYHGGSHLYGLDAMCRIVRSGTQSKATESRRGLSYPAPAVSNGNALTNIP